MKYLFKIHILILAGISLFLLSGCSETPVHSKSKEDFNKLLRKAIAKDKHALDSLGNFFDPVSLPEDYTEYQLTEVTIHKNSYYLVTLQHRLPYLNRFCIFDQQYRLRVCDLDVNGDLSAGDLKGEDIHFITLTERFVTGNNIIVSRLHAYSVVDDSVAKVLRTYTDCFSPSERIAKHLIHATATELKFEVENRSSLPLSSIEVFTRTPVPGKNVFFDSESAYDSLITSKIRNYPKSDDYYSITNPIPLDSLDNELEGLKEQSRYLVFSNLYENLMYYLPPKWVINDDTEITGHISRPLRGHSIRHPEKKATLYFAKLPIRMNANDLTGYAFSASYKGVLDFQMTGVVRKDEKIVQYFIVKCKDERFLMILEADEKYYDQERILLDYIIHTVGMECDV